ncbi:hypothetical protein BGX26_004887, partial [Mortierella sp. AD094]
TTTGDIPGTRFSHCMVPAYNGTNMILFGGQDINNQPTNTIYILDILNQTWTKGNDISPTLSRNGGACAVVGDNFVGWGGNVLGQYPAVLSAPVIYNLKYGQWTTQYTVSVPTTPTTNASVTSAGTNSPAATNPVETSSKSSSAIAPIIGGVVAGVFILAIAGYFVRKRSKHGNYGSSETESSQGNDIPSAKTSPKSFTMSIQAPRPLQLRNPHDTTQYYYQPGHEQPLRNPQPFFTQSQTPLVAPSPRNPQVRQPQQQQQLQQQLQQQYDDQLYSNDNNQVPWEQQVAQIKSQYGQRYQRQQQYLEQIRLEEREHLEMLQKQQGFPKIN